MTVKTYFHVFKLLHFTYSQIQACQSLLLCHAPPVYSTYHNSSHHQHIFRILILSAVDSVQLDG